ncbi:hypothetical protein LVD13_10170 [Flavobacteriaceae bacterium D16]|nr:hypothetical protein [Flavobacteriaceae bacterium D16]
MALYLNVPLPKVVMVLAYGITKLKAKEILSYTLLFMMAVILVFVSGLLIF